MVIEFFGQPVYGIKFSEVFSKLDALAAAAAAAVAAFGGWCER
jgi:hypothetical protein